jgi:plasmid stabilization system protein ParE
MRVRLSKGAILFLRREREYLEQFNPRAAANVMRQLREALRLLGEYPNAGSPFEALEGRRRFVAGSYVIDYRVGQSEIRVSHMRHGRQLPPDLASGTDKDE